MIIIICCVSSSVPTPFQGESNTVVNMDVYNCSFPAMIDDWRSSFHEASGGQTALDFPFGFVQVSRHYKRRPTAKNKTITVTLTTHKSFVMIYSGMFSASSWRHSRSGLKLLPGTIRCESGL